LLGAHIVAPHAEEMILYFDLALRAGHMIDELAESAHFPGLTYGQLIHQALEAWLTA
jgi:pyruvate/2-oxoglutarate dehydrogenase complex dihydrolipoamide dehydrogenase (E3) component